MSTVSTEQRSLELLSRLERVPMSRWHVKLRVVVGTATMFDAIDALMIAYIMPVLIPLWGISPAAIGPLLSISYVGQLLGAIVFGSVADKIGRKKTLVIAILVMGCMSLVCAFAYSYTSLLVFRFVQGFGLGGEMPVAGTYINEWSKAKGRGPFFVLYESVFIVGMLIAALLSVVMIPNLGWQSMFVLGAVPALIVPIFIRKFPESPRFLINKGRIDEAETAIIQLEKETVERYQKELPAVVAVAAPNLNDTKMRVSELFSKMYAKRTIAIWLIMFCFQLINYGIQTWLPTLYTSQFGLVTQQALLRSMTVNLISLCATVIAGLIIDKVGRKVILGVCFGGATVVFAALAFTGVHDANTLFLYTCLYGIFTPVAAIVYLYGPELYPTRMRSFGFSTATGWMRVGAAIGPTMVGSIVANYSMGSAFMVLGIFAIVGLFVTVFIAIETKNRVLEEVSP